MKKSLIVVFTFLIVFSLSACKSLERGYSDCDTPDGTQACWSTDDENFKWEDGAVIEIGVDNDTLGNALVDKWNTDFPELSGKLVYKNTGSVGAVASIVDSQSEAPDVVLVIDNDTYSGSASLLSLHEYFDDLGSSELPESIFDTVNGNGTFYLPAYYDGMSFSWNKTMLESWSIDLTDANDDGLPEAFDTWEEIFAMADSYTTRPTFNDSDILEFFPISLDEPWSGYSSVTAANWALFAEGDLADPGFDDPAFKSGLDFISEFAQHNMSVDETGAKKAASTMGWRWDAFLDGAYPFGLVGTWMAIDEKEVETGYDFKFSAMPTYNDVQLSPLYKTKGFVINGFTSNPSASSEVLRWLYTKDVFEVMMDSSSYLPAINGDSTMFPEMDSANKNEFALGMRLNQLEVIGTLPEAPSVMCMDVYYSIGINDFYKAVWDGTKTTSDAQVEIDAAAKQWVLDNNVSE